MSKPWDVTVDGVGYLGVVYEKREELARCAALSKFCEEGNRPAGNKEKAIYDDDVFNVIPK